MQKQCYGLLAAFGMAILAPAAASETNQLSAEQLVEKRIVQVDAKGFETVHYETAKLVKPGDYLRYSIRYQNNMDVPADDIVLVMPVPEVTEFIPGSVKPETDMYQLSFDNGVTFVDPAPTGDAPSRPVTHIRWPFERSVAPGKVGQVSMDVLLK